jgi:hypothetical protein
MKSTET